jgi:hypothetical protein
MRAQNFGGVFSWTQDQQEPQISTDETQIKKEGKKSHEKHKKHEKKIGPRISANGRE